MTHHHSIIPSFLGSLPLTPAPWRYRLPVFRRLGATRIWWRALTSPCWTRSVQSWTSRRRWRKSSRWMKNMKTASRSQGGKVMKGDEITGNPMLFGRIGLRSSKITRDRFDQRLEFYLKITWNDTFWFMGFIWIDNPTRLGFFFMGSMVTVSG